MMSCRKNRLVACAIGATLAIASCVSSTPAAKLSPLADSDLVVLSSVVNPQVSTAHLLAFSVPFQWPDTLAVSPAEPYYFRFRPLEWGKSFYIGQSEPKLAFVYFSDFEFMAVEVDLSTGSAVVKNLGGKPGPYEGLSDYVSGLKSLSTATIALEPFDKGVSLDRTAVGITKPTVRLKGTTVWEGVGVEVPFFAEIIRKGGSDGGRVLDGKYSIPLYSYELLLLIGNSRDDLSRILRSEVLYRDGYSVIDGFDPRGFDRQGYDRDGYDAGGWNKSGSNKDGGRFTGRIVGGKRSGVGQYTSPTGSQYGGTYDNDSLSGFGIQVSPDGSRYLGQWSRDLRDGTGVSTRADGYQELQVWKNGILASARPQSLRIKSPVLTWIYLGNQGTNGLADGIGDAISFDGKYRIENGTFIDGVFSRGTLVYPDGTRYDGQFKNDALVHGVIKTSGGYRYEGELAGGVPNGKGTLVLADGTKYVGDFQNGKYEGQGLITRPNGEKYEGSFLDGLPHGMGIYFNGDQIERCEYYQGKRIDQAYLIQQENQRNLEAMRQEREKAAKEKADQDEQARLATERKVAEQQAQSEHSSNNLLGSIIAAGTVFAVGGAVHLDTATTATLAASAALDAAKGDASFSGLKKAENDILAAKKSATSAASSEAPSSKIKGEGATPFLIEALNVRGSTVKVTHDLSHYWEPLSQYLGWYHAEGGDRLKTDRLYLDGNGTGHFSMHRGEGPFEAASGDGHQVDFVWGILLGEDMKAVKKPDTMGWGNQYVIVVKKTKSDDWPDDAWSMGTQKGLMFLAEGAWTHD